MAAVTTSSTERLCPRWITSAPWRCRIRRMMLIAASCPSNRLAAVTNRTGWAGRAARPSSFLAVRVGGPRPNSRTSKCLSSSDAHHSRSEAALGQKSRVAARAETMLITVRATCSGSPSGARPPHMPSPGDRHEHDRPAVRLLRPRGGPLVASDPGGRSGPRSRLRTPRSVERRRPRRVRAAGSRQGGAACSRLAGRWLPAARATARPATASPVTAASPATLASPGYGPLGHARPGALPGGRATGCRPHRASAAGSAGCSAGSPSWSSPASSAPSSCSPAAGR